MDNSPKITRKFRLAGLLLPLGGVLLGTGGLCLWLQSQSPLAAEQVLSRQVQSGPAEHLQIITTQSLYMNDFKAPSLAHETWEEARDLIYARVPSAREGKAVASAEADKNVLGLVFDAIRVHEAHAQTGEQTGNQAVQNASTRSPDGKVTPMVVRMAESDHNKAKSQSGGQAQVQAQAPSQAPVQAQAQAPVPASPATAPATQAAAPAATVPAASPAANPAANPAAVATAPQAPQAPGAPREAAKSAENSAQPFPQRFSEGTLGHMTQLRAELEQLKLQVTIEEARSRLNQLRGNTFAPATRMPSLEYPPIGLPGGGLASHDNGMRILSIQSVNGRFTATVGTSSGPRVVSNGDTINGNKVVSISRNSVVINRGEGNETLSIQD